MTHVSGDQNFPAPGNPDPQGPSGESGFESRNYHQPVPPPGQFDRPGRSGVPPHFLGAAHKPGAIPLRPLNLGDIYNAAFKIIRVNPKATVGAAVLVASIAMAIPVLLTAGFTFSTDLALDADGGDFATADIVGLVASFGGLFVGAVLQSIGLVLVTGMIAHVVSAAALGQRLSLGQAWALTHGKRWRLLGLALVLLLTTLALVAIYATLWVVVALTAPTEAIVIFGLVSVPLFLAGMFWFWIRAYYLPVPALMLEEIGVFGAIGRAYQLTGRAFWRTFGVALLTVLIAQTAGYVLSLPFAFLGQIASLAGAASGYAVLILVVSQALSSVITTAFVAPFTGAVTTIQYIDQRIRKEAYDVELMSRAGLTRS